MAKRPISDLTRALDIVDILEGTIARHDSLIAALLDRVDDIERRLGQLPPSRPPSRHEAG